MIIFLYFQGFCYEQKANFYRKLKGMLKQLSRRSSKFWRFIVVVNEKFFQKAFMVGATEISAALLSFQGVCGSYKFITL